MSCRSMNASSSKRSGVCASCLSLCSRDPWCMSGYAQWLAVLKRFLAPPPLRHQPPPEPSSSFASQQAQSSADDASENGCLRDLPAAAPY